MAADWLDTELGNVVTLQRGFDLPIQDRKRGGVPIVSSSGISGTHCESRVQAPGVVTGRYGTIGQVFFIREHFWPLNTTLFVKDFKGNDPRFVAYLLQTIDFESCSDKSSVPGLNRNDLHSLPVRVPPLAEQRAIAHILGTLDDKIELNRRMNETLEAIARAIFKSWFVDFDPVRAKAEGRQPFGMDAETASLFPDSFEDSPLGKIPKGWKVTGLAEAIEINDSKRVPLSSRQRAERKGRYPYYGAAGVLDHVDDYLFDGTYVLVGEDGSVITEDDTPVVQYVWGRFWVNNHAHVLTGSSGVSNEQLLLFLRQLNVRPYVTGAVQPKLNQGNLQRIPFLFPDQRCCGAFRSAVDALFARVRGNEEESKTLSAIRDALLPRLISGEVRAADANGLS